MKITEYLEKHTHKPNKILEAPHQKSYYTHVLKEKERKINGSSDFEVTC